MKSSTALTILLFLAGTEALPQRSTHDSLLERNFKNVLSAEEEAALAKRFPQGPSSNPGEFTNVGLSNLNPNHFVPEMGGDSMSESASSTSQPASITASASFSSGRPDTSSSLEYQSFSYGDSGLGFQSDFPESKPSATGHHHRPTGHHHRPCATGASGICLPEPTGHHHHHNGTGRWHHEPYVGEEFVETEADVVGDVVTVHETLWQYNGTGWNHTDIPVPSGTFTISPEPPSTASGAVGSGTGTPLMDMDAGMEDVPIDNGFVGPAFMFNAPRPGFVGPKEEESNEGTTILKEKRRWLSGIF